MAHPPLKKIVDFKLKFFPCTLRGIHLDNHGVINKEKMPVNNFQVSDSDRK